VTSNFFVSQDCIFGGGFASVATGAATEVAVEVEAEGGLLRFAISSFFKRLTSQASDLPLAGLGLDDGYTN
jgi:hypothetical protein